MVRTRAIAVKNGFARDSETAPTARMYLAPALIPAGTVNVAEITPEELAMALPAAIPSKVMLTTSPALNLDPDMVRDMAGMMALSSVDSVPIPLETYRVELIHR